MNRVRSIRPISRSARGSVFVLGRAASFFSKVEGTTSRSTIETPARNASSQPPRIAATSIRSPMLDGRIGIRTLKAVQAPILEIAQPRRDALSAQCKQAEDMVAGAPGVGVMLVDVDSALMSVEPVEHIDGFILG